MKYPKLKVSLDKLTANINCVTEKCAAAGIKVCGVVKGFNGLMPAVERFAASDCSQIGTSRMTQIIDFRNHGIDAEMLLLRIPMISEAEDVVRYADMSLNSEPAVVKALDEAAGKAGKVHKVILMADLGDLREGFWDAEQLLDCAVMTENLDNVHFAGIGTNLGCYGSIKPDTGKMEQLVELAEMIEERIGRRLEIISGGATSSYPLVLSGQMPERINHLRIGEGIICSYDLPVLWGLDMEGMSDEIFTFETEIVEVKDKPTHPVGEIFVDAFGQRPVYEDRGIRKRAIAAAGKLDFALNDKIFPAEEGISVVGSSSDHLILDIEDAERDIKTGDTVTFRLSYPSVMYLSNDRYLDVEYI